MADAGAVLAPGDLGQLSDSAVAYRPVVNDGGITDDWDHPRHAASGNVPGRIARDGRGGADLRCAVPTRTPTPSPTWTPTPTGIPLAAAQTAVAESWTPTPDVTACPDDPSLLPEGVRCIWPTMAPTAIPVCGTPVPGEICEPRNRSR